MNCLFTVILLMSSVCWVIESFPKLEDITINKEKHQEKYSCFVKKHHQIKAVVCTHCEVIEDVSGYRVTTRRLQLMKLHFLHDGKVINVPFRLNCHREEQSPSTSVTQVMSLKKSIAITLNNKAGIIVLYMDGKTSFSAIQIDPVEDYEINGLHEDTLYQICISVLNKAGESGNYSCIQTKTKQLTNKGSAVANKNGDPCKYAVTSIEADVTAHNLVKVKWKIELQGNCQISKLEVRLFEKYSRKCLVLLVLYKRMKISKTVETDNCRERKRIRVSSLVTGEVLQFWFHSSVRVQGVIVTSRGRQNMNNGDYSSSNLIDNLQLEWEEITHTGTNEFKRTTCYPECLGSGLYKGISSADVKGKPCIKWSESKWSDAGEGNRCSKEQEKAWCATAKNQWSYCKIPACDDYSVSKSDCIESLTSTSTGTSITGQFQSPYTHGSSVNYLKLLFNDETKLCVDYTIPEKTKKYHFNHTNIKGLIASCPSGQIAIMPTEFTFKNLNYATNYKIYIIPVNEERIRMTTYYSERTKDKKPGLITDVTVEHVSSSTISVSWKAPEKSVVEKYIIVLKKNDQKKRTQNLVYTRFVFSKLTECTEYCVTVKAINNGGLSPVSEDFCERTFARGEGKITLGNIHNGSSLSRNISWSHSTENCVDLYKIIYWPMNKGTDHLKEKHTNKTFFYLVELLSKTQYKIKVQALLNRTDMGSVHEYSNLKSFQTGTPEKPARVTRITVKPVTSSSINVSWEAPEKSVVEVYSILLKKNYTTKHTGTTDHQSYKFDELTECTEYCVTVTAKNYGGLSPVSEDFCERTFARGGGKITLGKIHNGSHLSRNISWSHSTENCVDLYTIIYWPKNKGPDHLKEKHTNKTFFYLVELLPKTQYKIKVQALLSRTDIGIVNVSLNIKSFVHSFHTRSFYTGRAQGAKNIPLITVLCVLVAFIAK